MQVTKKMYEKRIEELEAIIQKAKQNIVALKNRIQQEMNLILQMQGEIKGCNMWIKKLEKKEEKK